MAGLIRGLIRGPRGARTALIALLVLGLALRVLVSFSWWPVSPTLQDGYQLFAGQPFADSLHPPGYAVILWLLGHLTRQVAFTVVLQHVAGLAAALLLWAATRRVTGSSWAGLLPAAAVLLDPDEVFLEHAIMSESWAILAIAAGLYWAVRTAEDPGGWVWPMLTGAALAAAALIRTASLPMLAVVGLAILLWPGQPWRARGRHLRAALTAVGAAALVLVSFAGASAASGHSFGIAPSPGWYLYGRVAQFADCRDFTPPAGTRVLCQTVAPARRPSGYFYEFERDSPAIRSFGSFGRDDGLVGAWARRALLAQPGAFLATAWGYLRAYYFPAWLPARLRSSSTELDPQLDYTHEVNPFYQAAGLQDLASYFGPFRVHTWSGGLRFLHGWQRVIRFGATALLISTLLTLFGLGLGARRGRVGVLLFGVGGLSLLLAPVLTGTYAGRYTVPMAGPLMAAAAISISSLLRLPLVSRRLPGASAGFEAAPQAGAPGSLAGES